MAKIKEAKPQSGPLEKPSVSEVVRATVRAKVRAVKPYLRVPSLLPDPPPPHPQDPSQEGSEEPTETALPKAEKLYKNHLFNQSGVSAWYVFQIVKGSSELKCQVWNLEFFELSDFM